MDNQQNRSPQTTSLTLRLHESQDVTLANRALNLRNSLEFFHLHVADDVAGSVVQKLDTHLQHTTLRTGAAKDLRDL